MTVQDILTNNSKKERITIIACSQKQYNDFMYLLHTQGYVWSSGKKVYGEDCFIPQCFKSENNYAYMLFTITLDSEKKIITYTSPFFNGCFDLQEFKDSVSFLFGADNTSGEPFANIYKPYLVLRQEIEDYAEDYEL